MRTVSISWDPVAGRFVASGSHRGQEVAINAPRLPDETRGATGFSATELLLAGAGACSAWDVVEILRKRRHEIDSLRVVVEGEQAADPPWEYRRVTLHFAIAGRDLSRPVLERVIRLSCMRYCSVLATIGGVARVEATLELLETATAGARAADVVAPADGEGRVPVSLPATPAAETVALDPADSLPVDEG